MRRGLAYAVLGLLCHCGGSAFTSADPGGLAAPEGGGDGSADEGVRMDTTGGSSGSIGAEGPDPEEGGGEKHRDAASTSASNGGSGGETTRGSSGGVASSSGATGIGTTGGVRDAGSDAPPPCLPYVTACDDEQACDRLCAAEYGAHFSRLEHATSPDSPIVCTCVLHAGDACRERSPFYQNLCSAGVNGADCYIDDGGFTCFRP